MNILINSRVKLLKTFLFIHAMPLFWMLSVGNSGRLATDSLPRLASRLLRLHLYVALVRPIGQLHGRLTGRRLDHRVGHCWPLVNGLDKEESPRHQANQQTADSPSCFFHVLPLISLKT